MFKKIRKKINYGLENILEKYPSVCGAVVGVTGISYALNHAIVSHGGEMEEIIPVSIASFLTGLGCAFLGKKY